MKSKFTLHFCLLAVGMLVLTTRLNAQQSKNTILTVALHSAEEVFKKYPSEKLYLNFDKPYYAVGDTAWFKVYALNGQANAPSKLSVKVYVELYNDSTKLVKKLVIPIAAGLGSGYLPLQDNEVFGGNYTVRAYTAWMRNFSEDYFFHLPLLIANPGNNLQAATKQKIKDINGQANVSLDVNLTDGKSIPVVNNEVDVKIYSGDKTIYNVKANTDVKGSFGLNFQLPEKFKGKPLSLTIRDKGKRQNVTVPLYFAGDADIDLQFMPEGGQMVAGVYNRIGFKAINNKGFGTDISGVIVDAAGKEVSRFESLYKGIGSFSFIPQANVAYKAILKNNGEEKAYDLPLAKPAGIVMRTNSVTSRDSVFVYLNAVGVPTNGEQYMIVGQSRDQIFYGATVKFDNNVSNIAIPKNVFPAGVVRFSLLNSKKQPLNERAVFIEQPDKLLITLESQSLAYNMHDSIPLNISVINRDQDPVSGSFSVAVTADNQVKNNTGRESILSHMLLTSDLKGYVETPGYYFSSNYIDVKRQLDNLLLTQGWVGYSWDKLNAPLTEPTFFAEPTNGFSGVLKNIFGKPVKNNTIYLVATGKGAFLADTLSDNNGRFNFQNLPWTDTIGYTFKVKNAKNHTTYANVDIDEVTSPPFTGLSNPYLAYQSVNDTTLKNYVEKQSVINEGKAKIDFYGINHLKTVVINGKRNIQINNAFLSEMDKITTQELVAAGNKSLMDLLYIRLKGFKQSNFFAKDIMDGPSRHGSDRFVINQVVVDDFIVDGVSIKQMFGRFFTDGPTDPVFSYVRDLLNYVSASSVKDIRLFGRFKNVIFITTRSGSGPWIKPARGIYVYHPLPIQAEKQFYVPKYTAATDNSPLDLRSTIFWEPLLVTNNEGKGGVSFFAASKPGTYTITIEGTDMQGRFGVTQKRITIKDTKIVQTLP